MATIQLTGSLPGLINENTPLWDWVGQLRLSINPALIRYVDLTGMGGNFFDAALNASTGLLTIRPIAQADYEWFVANNLSATMGFALRFFMTDGSVLESEGSYSVTVLNIDDTAPQGLGFATGGSVAAGAAGASIGRLLVSDPDTATGFTFTIQEDEQWMFEIVGGVLRLRAGISIPLADGPERPLVITVSDGHQSAALTLQIGVTVPAIGGVVDLLEAHERQGGFHWAAPGNLVSMHMSYDMASIRDYGALIHIQLRDGDTITVEQPRVIDLLDGYITFSGDGLAGRVWAIYETVLNREPRNGEMAAGVASLAAGNANEALLAGLLNSREFADASGGLSNAGFVDRLYQNSVGWVDQGGAVWHVSGLDQGKSRVAVAADFVSWRLDSLNHADARAENGGFFVPRSWVEKLDTLVPAGLSMDPTSFGHWWADQVITGRASLDLLPAEIMRAQGPLSRLEGLDNRSGIERFFTDMAGAPAESNWVSAFSEMVQKTGVTTAQYLDALLKSFDLDAAYAHQTIQGVAFQNGW